MSPEIALNINGICEDIGNGAVSGKIEFTDKGFFLAQGQ